MTATSTALRLIAERFQPMCEVEGCINPAEEAHHVFYGRRKGKPELDVDENFQLVCRDCHKFSGRAKSYRNRVYFWSVQCKRYGRDHMVAWHEDLDLKIKDKYYL